MLAWRRTTLSLFVAALIISRLAVEDSAPFMVVIGSAAAIVSLWIAATSLRRRRWSAPSLREPQFELLLRDAKLPAFLVGIAGSLCLVELTLALIG